MNITVPKAAPTTLPELDAYLTPFADIFRCRWSRESFERYIYNGSKGFQVQPKCWFVERTFAWLSFCRRLSKDYERTIQSSETMVTLCTD